MAPQASAAWAARAEVASSGGAALLAAVAAQHRRSESVCDGVGRCLLALLADSSCEGAVSEELHSGDGVMLRLLLALCYVAHTHDTARPFCHILARFKAPPLAGLTVMAADADVLATATCTIDAALNAKGGAVAFYGLLLPQLLRAPGSTELLAGHGRFAVFLAVLRLCAGRMRPGGGDVEEVEGSSDDPGRCISTREAHHTASLLLAGNDPLQLVVSLLAAHYRNHAPRFELVHALHRAACASPEDCRVLLEAGAATALVKAVGADTCDTWLHQLACEALLALGAAGDAGGDALVAAGVHHCFIQLLQWQTLPEPLARDCNAALHFWSVGHPGVHEELSRQGMLWGPRMVTMAPPVLPEPFTRGEDVFAQPPGALKAVLDCLDTRDACVLRAVCRDAEAHVAGHPWADTKTEVTSLSSWRACFPRAVGVRLHKRVAWSIADFMYLQGIKTLCMEGCNKTALTDHAFAHLGAVETLVLRSCALPKVTGACFAPLTALKKLDASFCGAFTISALDHLSSLEELSIEGCDPASLPLSALPPRLPRLKALHMPNYWVAAVPNDTLLQWLSGLSKLVMGDCGITFLVAAAVRAPPGSTLAAAAASLLASRAFSVRTNELPALMSAFEAYNGLAHLPLCEALANSLVFKHYSSELGEHWGLFLEHGGLRLLIAAMQRHVASPIVVQACSVLLRTACVELSSAAEVAATALEAGLLPTLVQALRHHAGRARVLEQPLLLLQELLERYPAVSSPLLDADGVAPMLAATFTVEDRGGSQTAHADLASAAAASPGELAALLQGDDGNRIHAAAAALVALVRVSSLHDGMAAASTAGALLSALRRNTLRKPLAEKCCALLRRWVNTYPDFRAQLSAVGGFRGVLWVPRSVVRPPPRLSALQRVLQLPQGHLAPLLDCLDTLDARALRAVCRDAEAHVANHPWSDTATEVGNLARWRACFPRAIGVRLKSRWTRWTSSDFVYLEGIKVLRMDSCYDMSGVRDDAFAFLTEVEELSMRNCHEFGATPAAFSHLRALKKLDAERCALLCDAAFPSLTGLEELRAGYNGESDVTDAAFQHVGSLRLLDVSYLQQLGRHAQRAALAAAEVRLRGTNPDFLLGLALAAPAGSQLARAAAEELSREVSRTRAELVPSLVEALGRRAVNSAAAAEAVAAALRAGFELGLLSFDEEKLVYHWDAFCEAGGCEVLLEAMMAHGATSVLVARVGCQMVAAMCKLLPYPLTARLCDPVWLACLVNSLRAHLTLATTGHADAAVLMNAGLEALLHVVKFSDEAESESDWAAMRAAGVDALAVAARGTVDAGSPAARHAEQLIEILLC